MLRVILSKKLILVALDRVVDIVIEGFLIKETFPYLCGSCTNTHTHTGTKSTLIIVYHIICVVNTSFCILSFYHDLSTHIGLSLSASPRDDHTRRGHGGGADRKILSGGHWQTAGMRVLMLCYVAHTNTHIHTDSTQVTHTVARIQRSNLKAHKKR